MKRYLIIVLLIACFGIYFLNYSNPTKVETAKIVNVLVPEATPSEIIEKPRLIKLMLVGDIMLGRNVNITSLEQSNPKYPFEKVADKLRSADIVFGNLESPIVKDCPKILSGFQFCGDERLVEGLTFSGIDVLSIANNHNMNFGKRGYEETKEILTLKGIKWVGDSNLEIIEMQGTKFGFLGFDFVTNTTPTDNEWSQIREADPKVDVLVVGIHWGSEYKDIANNHQTGWATKAVESGADIISGHHPHWVQNAECFEQTNGVWRGFKPDGDGCPQSSKPVYYSLGNFIFDQMWSEETKKGLAIELTFEDGRVVKEERFPTYIMNVGQPEWVD